MKKILQAAWSIAVGIACTVIVIVTYEIIRAIVIQIR